MIRVGARWATALFLFSGHVSAGSFEAQVSSPSGKAVEYSAIVLEPVSTLPPTHPAAATIKQQGREFIPFVTIVQTGAAIDFPNLDPVKHHVYSFSRAKPFELKLYAGKPAKPLIFDKPGEVALGCNIHDWMEAYVLVVNTPYFAPTDKNGRAIIDNLPPGRYRLRLWHPLQKQEVPQREIEIGQEPNKLKLLIDITPHIAKPKPPLDEDSY
jgi:plastocyanin